MKSKIISLNSFLPSQEKEEIMRSYFESFELETSSDEQDKKSKEKTKYFYTSDSDDSDYPYSLEEIVEKTSDNSFGRSDELLCSCAYKRVYLGYDLIKGKTIAWTEFPIANCDPETKEKLIEQTTTMKNLNHPNIVNYITSWIDSNNNKLIILTEHIVEGSLRQNLKRICSPRLRLIKKWIKEILTALAYLHSMKIIHRDIKCNNIFLDRYTGVLKIGNLGMCTMICKKYMKGYVGKEEFVAPEVHEGKFSVKEDIYSLGMCILEMLTMEKPYKECNGDMDIYEHVVNGIYPESLNKIQNSNVVEFIKMCLKKENERPSAIELLQNNFLNDLYSEENDFPVQIINSLRLKNFYLHNDDVNSIESNEVVRKKVRSIKEYSNSNCNESDYFAVSCLGNKSPYLSSASSSRKKNEGVIIEKDPSKTVVKSKFYTKVANGENKLSEQNKKGKSSFEIVIKQDNQSECNSYFNNVNNNSENEGNSVEIKIIVDKEHGENKIQCKYNFDKDSVEGVIGELENIIDLSYEDWQIVKMKLNESLIKYINSADCEQCEQNTKLDEFNQSFDSFESQNNFLNQSNGENKDQELCNYNLNSNCKNEIINIIESFKKNEKSLLNLMPNLLSSNVI